MTNILELPPIILGSIINYMDDKDLYPFINTCNRLRNGVCRERCHLRFSVKGRHTLSLTDISALSGLTQLTSLNLSYCHTLTDISALSGLTQLTSLDLYDCKKLSDISALSGLTQLTNLRRP